jgi:hypothetical protein
MRVCGPRQGVVGPSTVTSSVTTRCRLAARPAYTSGLEPKLPEATPHHVDAGERGRKHRAACESPGPAAKVTAARGARRRRGGHALLVLGRWDVQRGRPGGLGRGQKLVRLGGVLLGHKHLDRSDGCHRPRPDGGSCVGLLKPRFHAVGGKHAADHLGLGFVRHDGDNDVAHPQGVDGPGRGGVLGERRKATGRSRWERRPRSRVPSTAREGHRRHDHRY